ncbi:DNA polymerase III subunit alpha [Deinococcus sp. HMF7620]|uniref:DNA-directed DNA polymerase n=1 Tax=Deinococcus arboris TaxID=2682977 RepID=A0A7C9M2E5_9DEIO|nr:MULTISPECIES: DNA polymerase III subunit alpha [Deinococcus]MBZ9752166.1 DNA polymerase III subunit alpha [Deinococcus betulae]MVN87482.1 DNA polymerase III subunit alpha [Deinococcus arboris]
MPPLSVLLTTQSFFSEGRSTVSPRRLVQVAHAAGFTGVGLVDWCSVAGAVELSTAARAAGLTPIIGVTLPVQFPSPPRSSTPVQVFPLVLLAQSRTGYATLCELITAVNLQHPEGVPLNLLREVGGQAQEHLVCLTGGREGFPTVLGEQRDLARAALYLRQLRQIFPFQLYVQLYHGEAPQERRRLASLRGLARDLDLPVVAAPEVRLAHRADYPLLDALTCARLGIDVHTPHPERPRNDALSVETPAHWGGLLPFPDGALNAARLAQACTWPLLPERLHSPVPRLRPFQTAQGALEDRARAAVAAQYPGSQQAAALTRLTAELSTVAELDLAGFFLTAAEVTDYCRQHGILAAGRGSAAGSVLCYLLGITLSDPLRHDLLFERFLHTGRTSMPDVDIDIASSRRDQVLAWVEARWGLTGAGEAMVANRMTYRLKSALQDLGRALGLPPELRDRLSRALGRDFGHLRPHRVRDAAAVFGEVLGEAPVKEALLGLLERIEPGFVRHLAPHSGGVVLSGEDLTTYSPLTRSSGGIRMLTFDKDDVEALGLIKLDLLGLRMLSALERAREEVLRLTGQWVPYGELPDDLAVWREIGTGDTLGLFQIESPAQTQLAARLQPRTMTHLAHQIALIRPGPIQSGTVHPYVRRARGEEPVPELPEPLAAILAPTHGTLLFQEQILRLAVQYAGLDWPAADRFRSALSRVEDEAERAALKQTFVSGAAQTCGAFPWEAEAVFDQCAAFRGYGFAESHAWAFAAHSYASAWMRRHHPAAYFAGFLSEAPGLWPAHTAAQEARRRGVRLAPVCLNRSGLAYRAETAQVVRVPLRAVEGISEDAARQIVQERLMTGKFQGVADAYDRLALPQDRFDRLVRAGAFDGLDRTRRQAFYELTTLMQARPPGTRALLTPALEPPALPDLSPEALAALDLETKGLSETGRHPLDAHRARLRDLGCEALAGLKQGATSWAAGLIVARQRPPTAKGFAFYVLEDATGRLQAVISPDLWEVHRVLLRDARALIVQGPVTRQGRAVTLRVDRLAELPLRPDGEAQAAD